MTKSKNNVEKTETQELSNKDRLENLIKQREEVRMMLLKIQGAIELLQQMEGENVEAQTEPETVG